jgi:protein-tyrosine phosphatase
LDFIDLHLHLLPEVDDGCRTQADALDLAKALVRLGFATVAPSPHHRSEYASEETALSRLGDLRAALEVAGVPLALEVNAESAFVDDRLLLELAEGRLRTLKGRGGRCLLIEAPYSTPLPTLPDLVFRMKLKGVTPLIAHPERCLEFERKGRAEAAVQAGALLQLDVGALIGRYGKAAQRLARRMLDAGLYTVAATDLHSPVNAERWVTESLDALAKAVGAAGLRALFSQNPAALLRGETLG